MWIKIQSYFICNLGNLFHLLPLSRWATSSLEATISIIVTISVTLVTYLLYLLPPLGGPTPLLNHHLCYSNYLCNLGNLPPLLPPLGGPPPLLNHHLYYSTYLCNLANLPPLLSPSRWATSSLEATISIIVTISVTLVTYLLYCPL